jgi:ketosteroid isomerase-like protein
MLRAGQEEKRMKYSGALRSARACLAAILISAVVFGASPAARSGQKNKKSKDADASPSAPITLPGSNTSQIEDDIGEMLAAFQLGNVEMMHKYYADNATWVRSTWDPPVMGWQNYVAIYNRQRAAIQGMQIIRKNTYIFTQGDVAWATYQFEFDALLSNGKPYSTRGQTTLVFVKSGDNWLIVHNHTSESLSAGPAQQALPQSTAPNKP